MKKTVLICLLSLLLIVGTGCRSMNNKTKGGLIGGAGGAVLGGLIGKAAGNTLLGAIIGAAVGGAAGVIIGSYMDRQAAELRRDLEGARVERVGEGIKITFDSGILFDIDRSDLRPLSRENLTKLAVVLNKYSDTNVLIEGHTDSTGSVEHNLALSKDRAASVAQFLALQNVFSARFTSMGYGESQPMADNATEEGRQKNRRVDIAIMANEKLKKAAQKQAQG